MMFVVKIELSSKSGFREDFNAGELLILHQI